MSVSSDDQAETARALRAASAEYGDLPSGVADRLDRVLEQLPSADTLHHPAEGIAEGWIERLRARRVRYALLSAAAALLVTVGGVAAAVQYVSGTTEGGSDEAAAVNETQHDQPLSGGDGDADDGEPDTEDFGAEQDDTDEPETAEEATGVETFATGSDYGATTDLLEALRDLSGSSAEGEVPVELAELAEGGRAWQECQDALADTYDSLVVAADFARYESDPAVMALLVSDSGEYAVAVTPACGNGVISELAFQK